MQKFTYQNFEIVFTRTENKGEYSAGVFGPDGDGKAVFRLDEIFASQQSQFPETSLAEKDVAGRQIIFDAPPDKLKTSYILSRSVPDADEAKQIGGKLYRAVFKDSLLAAWTSTLTAARKSDNRAYLRIRLHLTDVPELARLPWEYLYNSDYNHFFCKMGGTPVIRYLNQDGPISKLSVDGALRMLVVTAEPAGAPSLNIKKECEGLREALKPLTDAALLELDVLENATPDVLLEKIKNSYHIFHFIGHGVFDRQKGEGYLLFEDENGKGRLVSGEGLATILADSDCRLAVINACDGAVSSESNTYKGVAQNLCGAARLPAVIAMQFKISDVAAIKFAEKFYKSLAVDLPVERALEDARRAIFIMPNEVEWATPVLYMKVDDGQIRVGAKSDVVIKQIAEPEVKTLETPENPEAVVESCQTVIELMRDGLIVPFVGLDANLFGRPSDPNKWESAHGLPGSAELAGHISRSIAYPFKDLPDLAQIAQYSSIADRRDKLDTSISNIFAKEGMEPNDLHTTIAELAKTAADGRKADSTFFRTTDSIMQRFLTVTSCYDDLLEKAFQTIVGDFHVVSYVARGDQRNKFAHIEYTRERGRSNPVYIDNPNNYNGLGNGHPVIIKIPGTPDKGKPSFAITEDDYFNYLTSRGLTGLLPSVINDKLKGSSQLFLGYSPSSWNLRLLLYRIWEDDKSYRESWAVLKKDDLIEEIFWKGCQVKLVKSDLKKYIETLRKTLIAGVSNI